MRILVTAGPTREPIDPVRFISNRSSGKMGYAVARAAAARGHAVRLVSGPVHIAAPAGVDLVRVETADEMLLAVANHLDWCQALVMAAAPADWRPAQPAGRKLKKAAAPAALPLARTPDILQSLLPRKGARTFVGFAAETGDPIPEARRKLRQKGLDLIVGNDVTQAGAGFESDTNQVVLIAADGREMPLPMMSKDAVGERIVRWLEERAAGAAGTVTPRLSGSRLRSG
jgi:phosphopantothenoylcysteine decarboxylase/phosphopantothenate--cysteine ligase